MLDARWWRRRSRLSLALQGGSTQGAFGAGVLAALRDGASKALAHGPFLQRLFALGEQQGQAWSAARRDGLGPGIDLAPFG